MPKKVDLVGLKFGRLLVIKLSGGTRSGSKLWECLCDCGKTKLVSTRHLNRNSKYSTVIRSCGCLHNSNKVGNKSPWFKGYGVISRGYFSRHVRKSAKKRGKQRAISINIDEKYLDKLFIKQGGKCYYSGLPISLPYKWNDNSYTASVDRTDSSLGYIKGNVKFVHKHINIMKNSYSDEYFKELCKKVAGNSV